jgi:cell shape-determining protein MreD
VAYLLLIAFVYLAAVVDTALADALRVGNVAPDLVALVAVVWVLLVRSRWSFLTAGAVALLGDLIAPGRVGVGTAWMLLVGFALGWLLSQVRTRGLVVRLALATAAMIAWCLGVAATTSVLGDAAMPPAAQLGQALGAAVYTSAVALPVLMVAGWVRTNRETGL